MVTIEIDAVNLPDIAPKAQFIQMTQLFANKGNNSLLTINADGAARPTETVTEAITTETEKTFKDNIAAKQTVGRRLRLR